MNQDSPSSCTHSLDDITEGIVDSAVKLHQSLGPGLLESVYETILSRDLERRGFQVQRQVAVAFDYDGMHFNDGLKLDLLINNRVVLELKSVESLAPVHKKQLLTYLRLLHLPVGLLLNFGAPLMKDGIHRIVQNLDPSASPRLRVNLPKQFEPVSNGVATLADNISNDHA
jgi:GxxExxY protein